MTVTEQADVCVANRIYVRPSWGQADIVKAVTGVPAHVLRGLVNDHVVRAKKGNAAIASSFTVYNIADVEEWLETMAPDAGPFKVPTVKGGAE